MVLVRVLTSEDAIEPETGEHCDGEQHLSAPDHAELARGARRGGVRWASAAVVSS
jgi:hypothetical protein